MTETNVAALLEELTASYDDRAGDWERVAADARAKRHLRISIGTPVRLGVLVAAVAAAAALVLAWPFNNQHGTVLDHALAAVGERSCPPCGAARRVGWDAD